MEAQKDDGEFKMPDLCGTKGVSRSQEQTMPGRRSFLCKSLLTPGYVCK